MRRNNSKKKNKPFLIRLVIALIEIFVSIFVFSFAMSMVMGIVSGEIESTIAIIALCVAELVFIITIIRNLFLKKRIRYEDADNESQAGKDTNTNNNSSTGRRKKSDLKGTPVYKYKVLKKVFLVLFVFFALSGIALLTTEDITVVIIMIVLAVISFKLMLRFDYNISFYCPYCGHYMNETVHGEWSEVTGGKVKEDGEIEIHRSHHKNYTRTCPHCGYSYHGST